MKKILSISLGLFLLSTLANAQLWKLRRWEASAGLGTTQFYGDLGGYSKGENFLGMKDFTFKNTRVNLNTNIRYRILHNVSARMNFTFGYFHSTDENGINEDRGFESSTMFFEPSLIGEYYFIKNNGDNSFLMMKGQGNGSSSLFSMIDCYVYTGVGGLSYNVSPNDKMLSNTSETKGFTTVIPVGAGINLNFSSYINFGIELGGRFTFSDNIDGYTSPYSESNDVYHFLNFSFTYKIKTGQNGLPAF